jgi:hypothetical protein
MSDTERKVAIVTGSATGVVLVQDFKIGLRRIGTRV